MLNGIADSLGNLSRPLVVGVNHVAGHILRVGDDGMQVNERQCVFLCHPLYGGYHDQDWVPPLYEMDRVFFSGASEG